MAPVDFSSDEAQKFGSQLLQIGSSPRLLGSPQPKLAATGWKPTVSILTRDCAYRRLWISPRTAKCRRISEGRAYLDSGSESIRQDRANTRWILMNSNFYLPRKLSNNNDLFSEDALLTTSKFVVILAEPGAGKTVLMESIAQKLDTVVLTANRFKHSP